MKQAEVRQPKYNVKCPKCGRENEFYASDFTADGAECRGLIDGDFITYRCGKMFAAAECSFIGKGHN